MSQETLQTLFNVLPQVFDATLQRQWNRTALFLGMLNMTAAAPSALPAKNVAFAVEFTGATASTVAEGSDVATTEYASDIDLPAVLPWATYRSSFWVTEQEVDAAAGKAGSAQALTDLFGARMASAATLLASQINNDALVGTGVDVNSNPTLIGIYGGALSATAYGGINANTYTEWAGNVLGNGGVARVLTPDLIEQADANIFTQCGQPWDVAVGSAGVGRKYVGMFTSGPATSTGTPTLQPLVRMNDSATAPTYGLGPALGAGGVNADQHQNLYLKGNRFLRDRQNPVGKMALLNTSKITLKHLPRVYKQADIDLMQKLGVFGASGLDDKNAVIQQTGIPMRAAVLAKTGDSYKISCRVTCQLGILRRNAHALIADISEV